MAIWNNFFSWPLEGRAAIALAVLLVFLLLLHTPVLKILSLLPFMLKGIFRVLYLLLEWPISALHKFLGGAVYRIDNGFSACGKKIDTWLECWYGAWHTPKSWGKYAAVAVAACGVCYLSVIAPDYFHVETDNWKATGRAVYLQTESALTSFMEEQGWYTPGIPAFEPEIGKQEEPQSTVQLPLMVFRVSNVLRIRDIPSTLDGVTLDTAKSGDIVIWNGELTFGLAEGEQEAWAKVTTQTGIEGWGRLYYLCPGEGAELALTLTDAPQAADSAPPAPLP